MIRVPLLIAALSAAAAAIAPHSCAPGSPILHRAICNSSLPFAARAADLLSLFPTPLRVRYFGALTQSSGWVPYDAATNVKTFEWVVTCIHGLSQNPSPTPNVTVFPHAASLGATWDTALIAAVGAATATEARIVSALNYAASNGTSTQARSCAGGPLANTVHDARCTFRAPPSNAHAPGAPCPETLDNTHT